MTPRRAPASSALLLLLLAAPLPCNGFLSHRPRARARSPLHMGDRSAATVFEEGDAVTVAEDVMKAGRSLRGRSGTVVETWEKCDVDPTCCCAEWVDEGLSVRVRFDAGGDGGDGSSANDDSFFHYFAESELVAKREEVGDYGDVNGVEETAAFDGLSCRSFKLDRLSMGEQARRIAAFEESRGKSG